MKIVIGDCALYIGATLKITAFRQRISTKRYIMTKEATCLGASLENLLLEELNIPTSVI